MAEAFLNISQPFLALDTAVGATAALLMPDGNHISTTMQHQRAHSRELLPLLQGLLEKKNITWQALGGFVVGIGPGSFTGLRVACATVAGLNASLNRPIYKLNALLLSAYQAQSSLPVWVLDDARSGLVYAAKVWQTNIIEGPACVAWKDFLQLPAACFASVHDLPEAIQPMMASWQRLPLQISREQALINYALHAISQPHVLDNGCLEPLYLQLSQAEKNL